MTRPLLFDSLVHVTEDGSWFGSQLNASIEHLERISADVAPYRACIVGIDGFNMSPKFLLDVCRRRPETYVPIAGLNPRLYASEAAVHEIVRERAEQGFAGVKIHPTLNDVHLDDRPFAWVLDACASAGLAVFLCTNLRRAGYAPRLPPVELVYQALMSHPDTRVLLLHGGTVDLLSYADILRTLPNAMLDLSFTLLRYEGSSLEADCAFVLRQFNRRCTVGSDFPELSPVALRARVEALGVALNPQEVEAVLSRNLDRFLFPGRTSDE